MKKEKKIKILQDIIENQNKDIDKLRVENEQLRNTIYKNENITDYGYEKVKELQNELEQKIRIFNSLIQECAEIRGTCKDNLGKIMAIKKHHRKRMNTV